MTRVDRSEELYAKIASIPLRRRVFYNLLASIPVLVFPVAFYLIAGLCDRGGAFGSALVIVVLLNCFAIVGSLFWFTASNPWIPRTFSTASAPKKLVIISCMMTTLVILKTAVAPSLTRLDRMHAQHCEGRKANRYAAK